MTTTPDDYVFPEPWWDLRGTGHDEAERRTRLVNELLSELGPAPVWSGRSVEAVASFTRQDEELFRYSDGTWAIVHLTWAGRRDDFTKVRTFSDWSEVAAEVQRMAADW